jgi:hypothetical protein
MTRMTNHPQADLLHQAAEQGLHDPALAGPLARLGAAAVAGGVSATLLGILGDPRQPEVARLRALARIVGALDSVGTAAAGRDAVPAQPVAAVAPGTREPAALAC